MATKYINNSGTDLSFVYTPYTTGTKANASGYKTSTGSDLSDLFAKYVDYKAPNSGYLDLCGNDLSTLYQGIPRIISFNNMSTGANARVRYMHAYNSTNVFVAGDFSTIGVATATNHVARWNGSSWSALSTNGTPPAGTTANDIYAYDLSNVFVCNGNRVSRWDGVASTWSTFVTVTGGIPSSNVETIYVYDLSNIYIGGLFTTINSTVAANNIAMWNGITWSALGGATGGGTSGKVFTIRGYNPSNVYVGGNFVTVKNSSDLTVNNVAKWDGTVWSALTTSGGTIGTSTNVNENAIYVLDQNNVYIGSNNLHLWNGTNLVLLISSTYVFGLYAFDTTNVYFTGFFGGQLRRWNGSTATTVAYVDNYVLDIASIDNFTLILAGQFTTAGVASSGQSSFPYILKMNI